MPSAQARAEWTRLLAGAVALALAAAAVLAGIPVLFGSPQPMVHIQWRDVSASDRRALERQFRLTEPTELDAEEWSYVPADRSPDVLRAIVRHPAVEDTAGIDRRAFTISDSPPLTPRRGGLLRGAPPWMARAARALGYLLGGIAGVLLFGSALATPGVQALRRAIGAQITDPSSTGRTRLAAARARLQRGVTARFAETTAIVALFTAAVAWRFLTFTGFTNDHYAHLALAQQMLLGDRPIRDFADPGWPLTYLLSAAAWLVAGNTMAVEWALTATAFALGAACTVVAARRLSGSLSLAILVTVLEILIYPRTYSYPKVLAYAAGAWVLIALAAKPSLRRVALMAAVIVVAFLLRHDHGIYIGVTSAVCVALASRPEGWRVATRRVAILTGATGAFLLPWILFIAFNGGLGAYFESATEFARSEANASNLKSWPTLSLVPGRALLGLERPDRPLAQVEWTPDTTDAIREALERRYELDYVRGLDNSRFYYVRNAAADNVRALADDPHVAGSAGLGRVSRPAWREFLAFMSPLRLAPALHSAANADVWLFWLFWSLPLLCGAIVCGHALHGDERWPGELTAVAALCVMAALVNVGFLRDLLRTRFSDASVPAALLGAWALSRCWTGRWPRRILQSVVRAATVAVLTVTMAAISQIADLPDRMANTGIGDGLNGVRIRAAEVADLLRRPHRQDVSASSRVSAALFPFYSYLDRCTSQSDRLIVTGEFPDVVLLAGRRFAGDGVVFGAWYSSATHQDRTLTRLKARPALFTLLMDAPAFRARFPLINEYVAEEYEPMAEVAVEGAENVPILVHRNRTPVRVDAGTGWPCFL